MHDEKEESGLGQFIEVLGERPPPQANLPTFSVVMPSFNQGKFIERSILSVLNQDYPNIELIIVDGGSTDETVEILERYAKHITYWVSEKDEGQSDALNKGFARATGELVGWLNSDDLYLPDAFRIAAAAFKSSPATSVIFGDWWMIDEFDSVTEVCPAFDFSNGHFVYEGFTHNAQAMFWTKQAQERFGLFDLRIDRNMDYDLILRLGLIEGEKGFFRIDQALGCFRRHAAQKTRGVDDIVRTEHRMIADKLGYQDKFQLIGRGKWLFYRARRLYWYNRRRGVAYVVHKALGSVRRKFS